MASSAAAYAGPAKKMSPATCSCRTSADYSSVNGGRVTYLSFPELTFNRLRFEFDLGRRIIYGVGV